MTTETKSWPHGHEIRRAVRERNSSAIFGWIHVNEVNDSAYQPTIRSHIMDAIARPSATLSTAALIWVQGVIANHPRADQDRAREIYQQLVETPDPLGTAHLYQGLEEALAAGLDLGLHS